MSTSEALDRIAAICNQAVEEYGEGDYYLGRDSLANSILEEIAQMRVEAAS